MDCEPGEEPSTACGLIAARFWARRRILLNGGAKAHGLLVLKAHQAQHGQGQPPCGTNP